jgi:hypothetical protein
MIAIAASVVVAAGLVGFLYLRSRNAPEGCMPRQDVPSDVLVKSGCVISDSNGPNPRDLQWVTAHGTLTIAWAYSEQIALGASASSCNFEIKVVTPQGEVATEITASGLRGSGKRTLHVSGRYQISPMFCPPGSPGSWHLTIAE